MLIGIDRFTGEELSGKNRAIQGVETTLSTPFKSQPGKRDYGNLMPSLISAPANDDSLVETFGALVDAFAWEPELDLLKFGLTEVNELGQINLWYLAKFLPSEEIFTRIIPKAGASNGQ
ncbi:MAG: hypothetical protein JKY49_07555 [Cohaesibacteraceae bacterium]|nr:hypothetical protein [Cohaesibacteraceae bacterium]MBL4876702.1 hypothetical protein [Cohaesibacteraceae bacterium]